MKKFAYSYFPICIFLLICVKSHVEIAILFASILLKLLQFRCWDAKHLFHIAFKALEVWVIFEFEPVFMEILLEFFDVLGSVGLHSRYKHLTLVLGPRYADFLTFVSARHAPIHVHIVILNDPQDDIRGRDAFSALCWHKFPSFLDLCIDIFLPDTPIWKVIVSDIVDVIFVEEIKADYPGAGAYDFVDPFAMHKNIAPFFLSHDDLPLLPDCLFIARNANDQVNVWEKILGLLENACMPNVVHVKHSICIDADRATWIGAIVLDRR